MILDFHNKSLYCKEFVAIFDVLYKNRKSKIKGHMALSEGVIRQKQ